MLALDTPWQGYASSIGADFSNLVGSSQMLAQSEMFKRLTSARSLENGRVDLCFAEAGEVAPRFYRPLAVWLAERDGVTPPARRDTNLSNLWSMLVQSAGFARYLEELFRKNEINAFWIESAMRTAWPVYAGNHNSVLDNSDLHGWMMRKLAEAGPL